MSHRTGDIIADVVASHTLDPDSPPNAPECLCGARPLDGHPQHVSRSVQHAIATRSVPLSDTKVRILARDFTYEELQTLAVSGVDAFDLLRVIVTDEIHAKDRAASNGVAQAAEFMTQ